MGCFRMCKDHHFLCGIIYGGWLRPESLLIDNKLRGCFGLLEGALSDLSSWLPMFFVLGFPCKKDENPKQVKIFFWLLETEGLSKEPSGLSQTNIISGLRYSQDVFSCILDHGRWPNKRFYSNNLVLNAGLNSLTVTSNASSEAVWGDETDQPPVVSLFRFKVVWFLACNQLGFGLFQRTF